MIQYQAEMRRQIERIYPFEGHCYIQKIYSSSTLICLSARFKGETLFLHIGRGSGVEGFWVAKEKIPTELRAVDRFLEYLRKHLGSSELLGIYQVFKDRCLQIVYQKYGRKNSFIFFWKGRRLYFLNYFFDSKGKKFNLMKSWGDKKVLEEEIPPDSLFHSLFEVGLSKEWGKNDRISKTSVLKIISNEKSKLLKKINSDRTYKFLMRKNERICSDLEKIESAIELQEEVISGRLKLEDLGDMFTFKNFKIKFTGNMNDFHKKDRIFEKIKSCKKSKKILEERKSKVLHDIHIFNKSGTDALHSYPQKIKPVEPYWIFPGKQIGKNKEGGQKSDNYIRVFQLEGGTSFAVGLNAEGNDFLRTKWGNSNDLWLHLDGHTGPHIIAKIQGLVGKRENSALEVMASALRDYAGLTIEEIPIVFTRLKNIKGVKGFRGKVLYRKEKYIKMIYDRNWKSKVE